MDIVQQIAAEVLGRVLSGRNLNEVLADAVQGRELTAQERGALQDLCYGTLRFHGQLAAILGGLLNKPLADERIRLLLLVALYQLHYSKAAKHAIVDHAVRLAKRINPATSGLVNAVLRNFLRRQEELVGAATLTEEGRYSYPQWWIDRLRSQYADKAEAILAAGNLHPPMTLRVNLRRTSVDLYLGRLSEAGIACEAHNAHAIQLARPAGVDKLPGFFDGDVSVQDAGAQYAAGLLDVAPGMRVLDACAAPGGKTAHLLESCDLELLALDKDAQRLERVSENLQRLGLQAKLACGDAAEPAAWWDGRQFDRILADVPCSASGVVRRHPDIKWLRRDADIEGFALQQERILAALWPLLLPGGRLLYATCSVFGRENQQVVAAFLLQHKDAQQVTICQDGLINGQLLPNDRHDGFFYAVLQKNS